MADNFTRIIEKAKREGEAKLKVIAPKYTPPTTTRTSTRTGASGGARPAGPTRADLEAEQKRQAESAAKIVVEKAAQEAAKRATETAAALAATRTQQALRDKTRQAGPTREIFETQQALRREPQVQAVDRTIISRIKDVPSKAVEKVTGKKPREVFRLLIGSEEKDIIKEITTKELGRQAIEVAKTPLVITSVVAEKVAKPISLLAPEEGVPVTIKAKPAKEVTFLEPQFGTVTPESKAGMIERKVTVKARPERTVQIFERKRVKEGIKFGTELAAVTVAPTLFAPGFVAGGTEAALDPTRTPTQRALGVAEAGLGGVIVAQKAVSFLRAPIVTTRAARQIREPQAFEVQKTIPIKEKPTTVSLFEIRGEVRPPTIIERTTRGRKALDILGKQAEKIVRVGDGSVVSLRLPGKVTKIPAKEFIIKTPRPVIGKQPFFVAETQTGRRFATISRVEGVSKKISLEQFSKLSKQEQFLLQRRAMELTRGPVSLERVPVVLSREAIRETSLIKSQRLLRETPKKTVSDIRLVPGKRRPVLTAGVSEEVSAVKIDAGELIKARTLFKDVTFAGARTTGKTPGLDTTILRLSQKTKDTVKFVKPAQIKKTPFMQTFQKQEVKLTARVPIPKQKPIKPSRVVLEQPTTKVEKAIPSIVGGLAVRAKSISIGTGQVETTTPQVTSIIRPSMIDKQEPSVQIKQIEIQRQPEIQREKIKQVSRPKQIEILKSIGAQKIAQQPKQIEILKSLQQPKQIQQPKQLQRALQQIAQQPRPPKQPTPLTPFVLPSTTPAKRALAAIKKAVKGEFEVFARVEGQDVSIGKATTKKQAQKLLSKRLKKTIAASGFIEEGGRLLSAKETGLINGEFRTSRLDFGRVVQKKEARLGTAQETEQIQFFRQKGGGGNLFGSSSKKGRSNSGFSLFK